jgi:hypothetical protein
MAYNKYLALPQAELEAMFLARVRGGGKTVSQAGSSDTNVAFAIDRKSDSEEKLMASALMRMDPDKWIPLLGGPPITETRATYRQRCGY